MKNNKNGGKNMKKINWKSFVPANKENLSPQCHKTNKKRKKQEKRSMHARGKNPMQKS